MIKKKYVLTLISGVMSLGLLFGCADGDNNNDPVNEDPAGNDGNVEEPANDEAPANNDAPADNDTPDTP